MSTVLAALDTTAAARPVMETAVEMGRLMGAGVEVLHVREAPFEPTETPESLAAAGEIPFRLAEGEVGPALLAAAAEPDVQLVVVGARATPGGRRPLGRTASYILEHAVKPVVVVPPELRPPHEIRHLLVPLEGTDASSRPVLEHLAPLLPPGVEVRVLHGFTDTTLPAMLDRPEYDMDTLGHEFLMRHFPFPAEVELRSGTVPGLVIEASREHGTDLIVMSWSQDSSPGRAGVVQQVLSSSSVPVLILPVGDQAAGATAAGDGYDGKETARDSSKP